MKQSKKLRILSVVALFMVVAVSVYWLDVFPTPRIEITKKQPVKAVSQSLSAPTPKKIPKLVLLVDSNKALVKGKVQVMGTQKIVYLREEKAYAPRQFLEKVWGISIVISKDDLYGTQTDDVALRDVATAHNLSVAFDKGLIVMDNQEIQTDTLQYANHFKEELDALPTVQSKEELQVLLGFTDSTIMEGMSEGLSVDSDLSSNKEQTLGTGEFYSEFSETNIQVAGVDEGDIVKTDGTHIFVSRGSEIAITQAKPAGEMKLLSTITLETNHNVQELYLHKGQLIVILTSQEPVNQIAFEQKGIAVLDYVGYNQSIKTSVYVYDLSTITKPTLVKDFSIDGRFVNARRIEDKLYLLTAYDDFWDADYKIALPFFKDSASKVSKEIALDSITYIPTMQGGSIHSISDISLSKLDQEATVQSYIGGGNNLYMTTNALYIAADKYVYDYANNRNSINSYRQTNIYKFTLEDDVVSYHSKATVDGSIINQFAIDEHNGYLRIATTLNNYMGSYSALYVLNEDLKQVGLVKNIAPGERIYSVRFMGERAYMVTFQQMDPLFVIDVKDPYKPTILGELKIPGFSNYLHPYDDNHLIGFGKDTIVKDGFVQQTGLKISMFDVTDVSQPTEKFVTVIQEEYVDSELLTNHRALLFSKEKNLLALPVTIWNKKNQGVYENTHTVKQGAFVYTIDMEKGFVLEKNISHIHDNSYYDINTYVERILYIDDVLYTVSNDFIQAHSLKDFAYMNAINLGK